MKKGKTLAAIGCLLAIYVAIAPYITVYRIRSAAESLDGEALSEHIDFPSVRQSLKDQMNAMFIREMAKDEAMKDNPFAALGAAFAGVMVDKMIEAYVTPAGITQLMAGERPSPTPDGSSGGASMKTPLSNASMSYASLDKFVVKVEDDDGAEGKFVLRRRGAGWMLTEIIIPLQPSISTSAHRSERVTCTDLKYGSDGYSDAMESLAKTLGHADGYFDRYEEDLVSALCRGATDEVDGLIDNGSVPAEVAMKAAEALGKPYKQKARTTAGMAYNAARVAFDSMGLCNACADNVAQYFTRKPGSECGKLAQRALAGDVEAKDELNSFPEYCKWQY